MVSHAQACPGQILNGRMPLNQRDRKQPKEKHIWDPDTVLIHMVSEVIVHSKSLKSVSENKKD